MPSINAGDDPAWIGGPHEGLRVVVGFREEAVNGDVEIVDGAEDAALQPSSGELGEEALDGIEPGARGRGEVEDEPRVAAEPRPDLRMFVGGVIVEDDMDDLADRHGGLDSVQEPDELLVPVAPHDLVRADAVRRQQHDPRPPHVLLRTVPVRHHRFETGTIADAHGHLDSFAHSADSHVHPPHGNREGILMSEANH